MRCVALPLAARAEVGPEGTVGAWSPALIFAVVMRFSVEEQVDEAVPEPAGLLGSPLAWALAFEDSELVSDTVPVTSDDAAVEC